MDAVTAGEFPINSTHEVTATESMEEEMFLGLRKVAGVNKNQFAEKFGVSLEDVYGQVLSKYMENGSIHSNEDAVALTKRGRFIGNEIFQSFLID
jgi:oxygen-independent coproporphyrinogen-3 oxidase